MPAHQAGRPGRPNLHALGALLALALLAPAGAHADCHVKVAELKVHMAGTRAMTSVSINGHDVPLLIDTGAFYSTMTDAAAAQLGLHARRVPGLTVYGLTGPIAMRVTNVEHLGLSKGTIPDVEFLVGGNALDNGAMGVIGRNLLTFTDTEYDLAHDVVRLVFPNDDCAKANMAYWAEGDTAVAEMKLLHPQEDQFQRHPIRATIKLNGQDVDALFDTGATTLVTLKAARRAGVKEAAMTPVDEVYGAGRGSAKAWTAAFDSVELGGEAIGHNRLKVGAYDALGGNEMLVGIDFFLSHRVYVSEQQHKMFFTYNGGPIFMLNQAATAAASASAPAQTLDAAGYARRGAALRARSDFKAALADFDQACALAPQDASCFASRGELRQALKQPDQALADFDTALRLDPGQSRARLARASTRHDLDDTPGTLADLAELDRTLPAQSELRLAMAELYANLEEPARALPQLDQWIAVHPHDRSLAKALNERCWSRVLLATELAKALDDCDKAVDLDDELDASHLDSRGWVRLRQGQWKAAAADFDRALALKPTQATSLAGRAIARARLGDARASQADLDAAAQADAAVVAHLQHVGLSLDHFPAASAKP